MASPWPCLLTEGQVSDDKGYNSDRFREALAGRGIKSCIPGRANRKKLVAYDADLYKWRNLIERMFGRLKDLRRIATRYDRCVHTFFSAICNAATIIFGYESRA